MRIRWVFLFLLFCGYGISQAEHAYSLWGDVKYPPNFPHADYVNPNAPRQGEITLVANSRATNFDKYNPFILKGEHPPGLHNEGKNISHVFETLLTSTLDEPATAYGLLAEDLAVAKDGLSVVFKLNAKAKFSNGDPVLAQDVKHSFDMITSKLASPRQRVLLEDIKNCSVIDDRTVRFDFKKADKQMPFIAGSLAVFSRKWGGGKPFDQIITEPPIASGPYKIGKVDFGKTISYDRRPDYWGWHLGVRKGTYNFERITYKIYQDDTVRLEAFKADEFDWMEENIARRWARQYTGRKFDSGELKKGEFPNPFPGAYQGYVFNMRKPMFKDIRVRQALMLAMDFEWMNRQLFYSAYARIPSHFSAQEFTAKGLPQADELEFLEPLKSQLNPQVFSAVFEPGNTNAPSSLRSNLLKARELLAAAGWTFSNGAMRDAAGKAMQIEMLFDNPSLQRVLIPYQKNLEKLGIVLKFRIVDFALAKKRLDTFDFEMTSVAYGSGSIPGGDLKDTYGSESALREGNLNLWGLQDKAVDRLIEQIETAPSYAQLRGAARALDRVLGHHALAVPNWYSPVYRVAYKAASLEHPQTVPKYFGAQHWALLTWWSKKPLQNASFSEGKP